MESVLLEVAGHRRSSATMPGYHQAAHHATKASDTRPTHRQLRRSSPSCASLGRSPRGSCLLVTQRRRYSRSRRNEDYRRS